MLTDFFDRSARMEWDWDQGGPYPHIILTHMATRFAIAPLVMVKVDGAGLRKSPLAYRALLGDVVFGHGTPTRIDGDKGATAYRQGSLIGRSILPVYDVRLELLRHLVHIAPPNWAKWVAPVATLRVVRGLQRRPLKMDRRNMDFWVDVEALLQRQLTLRGWVSSYLVKEREVGREAHRWGNGEREVTRERLT
jgi:hypothetical protein